MNIHFDLYMLYRIPSFYAVPKMVCRSDRILGSRSRPMKSNKVDPILMDDSKVKFRNYYVN